MVRERFPVEGSGLERHAAVFDAVEINSSFHRPHRRTTYARWAESVPAGFSFSVKLPKSITHDRRLVDVGEPLARFAEEVAGLGDRRGPVLVQLPPSLAFEPAIAARFFEATAAALGGALACEPRHPSWFEPDVDALLAAHRVARVAADPARVPAAAQPGGWRGLTYARWHGSPAMYRSSYDGPAIAGHAKVVQAAAESWTIYDNTTLGAATANALALRAVLGMGHHPLPLAGEGQTPKASG